MCSTRLNKEECMDTWYRAGQGRVHGHMVHGWTKKSVWTHGTRLDKKSAWTHGTQLDKKSA